SDRPEPTVIARVDPTASAQPADTATASASPASGTASAGAAVGRSLEDAFDGFTLAPPAPPPPATGAVDITRIAIPREKVRPKPPPPPAHPARHWVQVATGKDRAALKFDWRRITRSAEGKLDGTGPFVTPWVEANRLLSGPYDSAAEAREMVNELKKIGVDSFPFTSAEGEAVEPL
ncbi:SPOR domain-containing protein, partial [Erythrobacter sp. HI0028]